MKQTRGTYALVGIAASEFADNTHQDKLWALLGYYAVFSGINPYRCFETNCRYQLQGSRNLNFLILEEGTERLSRNVSKILPLYAA